MILYKATKILSFLMDIIKSVFYVISSLILNILIETVHLLLKTFRVTA